MGDDGLVDEIYECAFLPELWPNVLNRLARSADSRGGCFVAGNNSRLKHWVASAGIEGDLVEIFSTGLINKSERLARVLGARHAGFLRDSDLLF